MDNKQTNLIIISDRRAENGDMAEWVANAVRTMFEWGLRQTYQNKLDEGLMGGFL